MKNITLCAIDTVNPLHALRALDLSRRRFAVAQTLFITAGDASYHLADCRIERVPAFASRADYSRFVVRDLLRYIDTSHVLLVQWDGYVLNADQWQDAFLDYDYIGAPWGWEPEFRVGNGGFSLRSRRLLQALQDPRIDTFDPEDVVICRTHRPMLERDYGIEFAPEALAAAFSFEATYPQGKTFGFHGLFNMWGMLHPQELPDFVGQLDAGTVRSPQYLQLAKNYLDLARPQEARVVLARRQQVNPHDPALAPLLNRLASTATAAAPSATPSESSAPSASVDTVAVLRQAMQLHQQGQLYPASQLYQQVLREDPSNALALHYLGVLAMQGGQPGDGERLIRRALALRDDLPDLHNNLGLCLRQLDRNEEALACYEAALALKPDYVEAMNNYGLDLQILRRPAQAQQWFERALALRPDFAQAHWNLSLALLLQGDLHRGWQEYEWRLRCLPPTAIDTATRAIPRWQGEPLAGKTVLVREEQGAGDTVQFCRFVSRLAAAGARVIFQAQPSLHALLASLPGVVRVVSQWSGDDTADYQIPVVSLAHRFDLSLADLPGPMPYLSVDPALRAAWQHRLPSDGVLKVGLVWAGNPKQANDRNRSAPLASLAPLFEVAGVTWYSLQHGPAAAQLPPPGVAWHALDAACPSFADTAAAILALDVVVSVCTSVIHLAGALGKPAILMLSYGGDWRWLQDRADSPWYPSITIVRQTEPGDWPGVARAVAQLLQARAAADVRASS